MTTDDIIKQAVDKFLPWKLPQNFYPDSFISFDAKKHDTWGGYPNSWPTGTNLFTSEQAKEMFEHCIRAAVESMAQERDALQAKLDASEKQESMYVDRACYERGCACYDPRVDKDPVLVVQPAPRPDHAKLIARLRGFSIPDIGPVGICDEAADALEALGKTPT